MVFEEDSFGSANSPIRIGMIIPSSNVTMERELPAILQARNTVAVERFSLHVSRVRMPSLAPEELTALNAQARRAATELSDIAPAAMVFACFAAIMAEGPGAHRRIEHELSSVVAESGSSVPVVSSAGALVDTLHDIGASRVAMIAPYLPPLTERVCDYLRVEGIAVVEARSLSTADNSPLDRLSKGGLLDHCNAFRRDINAVVLSACGQIPSLDVVEAVEKQLGIPVITAVTATVFQLLRRLGLDTRAPGAGYLLSGAIDRAQQTVR
jgi:maleate isomerase